MSNYKKTVLLITGSRAEYGLLRPVMHEIQKSKKLALKVLVTGMHTLKTYGNTQEQVGRDFSVACTVPIEEGDSMTDSLAKEIQGIGAYCEAHRPDMIVVLGDRDESFAGAIVGGHCAIPVAHIHGGDKTGWVVDEYIRHATTKFAHLHFPATHKSATRIRKMGEEQWRIITTGGPGLDELRSLSVPSKQKVASAYGLSPGKPWVVVTQHPSSLDTTPYTKQIRPLLDVVQGLDAEVILTYPNADCGSDVFIHEIEKLRSQHNIHIVESMPRIDLIGILKRAQLLVGNSSMGIIDASYLGLPAVNIGNRQAGRERGGNVIDADYNEASIRRAIAKAQSPTFRHRAQRAKSPYGDGRTAPRIVKLLEKYINRPNLIRKKLTYV